MRYSAVFLLALVCLNAVQCVSLRKNTETAQTSFALERLRFLGKKSAVASQVVAAIELHLTSGGKVDQVIDLVQQALDDVEQRRVALAAEFQNKQDTLNNIIDTTSASLADNQQSLQETNNEIAALEDSISHWNTHISDLHDELDSLAERKEQIKTARAADLTAFNARQQRDVNSISVLEIIIEKLQVLQARGPVFLQVTKKEMQKALSRIPKSNPIQALVQLSTKFDVETLNNVIGKLNQILTAIRASYADDQADEVRSEAHYNSLIAEVEQLTQAATEDLAASEVALANAESDLAAAQEQKANLEALISSEETLIAATQSELADAIVSYTNRLSEAQKAVEAVALALAYLKENAESLQSVEDSSDFWKEEAQEWTF